MSNYRPDIKSRRRRSPESITERLDSSSFDWEGYQGTYKGRALITRLIHISSLLLSPTSKPTSTTIAFSRESLVRVLKIIHDETQDYQLYQSCLTKLQEIQNPSYHHNNNGKGKKDEQMDVDSDKPSTSNGGGGGGEDEWVEQAKEFEKKESARLDVELRGYMSNLIKESIRLTYLASAQLAVKIGSIQNAMNNYTDVREYSTSPQHHVDLGVAILETCLAFNLPGALPGHISKLEATLERLHPPSAAVTNRAQASEAASITASDLRERREVEARTASLRRNVTLRVRVAKGIVALSNGDWTRAARELAEIGEEGGLGNWEGMAISSADLGLITAFCTLASADRDRIRRVLLDRPSFRAQVEDGSSWLIDLVRAFVDAKYGVVMDLLHSAEPLLLLNPFLSPHAQVLVNNIQTRAVVQYVQPFSSVQINVMANAFNLPQDEMLALVEGLVLDGDIKGRIDLIDNILEINAPDYRAEMYRDALRVGEKTTDFTQAALFRMKLIEAGIVVDPRPKKGDAADLLSDTTAQGEADEGIVVEGEEKLPAYESSAAPEATDASAVSAPVDVQVKDQVASEARVEGKGEAGLGDDDSPAAATTENKAAETISEVKES